MGTWCEAETSTDQDWIGLQFFENWRIRTGSDWENVCFFNVIILKYQKFQLWTDFTGLLNQGFLRRFRIENQVPRISENCHRVPRIRENRVPRIREIGSL